MDESRKRESPLSWRANAEDKRILKKLSKKLGVRTGQVLKIAIRRLEEAENK